MGSKAFMLIVLAILLVIKSKVAARELVDSKASSDTPIDTHKFLGGVVPGFGGFPRPGYPGGWFGGPGGGYGGFGGYPGGGFGGPGGGYGYPGSGGRGYYGGYPFRGGYGGFYPGGRN
ncbi:hypothetical protein P3S67_002413 [Capsicum chacoense]